MPPWWHGLRARVRIAAALNAALRAACTRLRLRRTARPQLVQPPTAAACARSGARPAGPARTCWRWNCWPPGCCSACATPTGARRCASPTPACTCWRRRCRSNRAARDAHEALVDRVALRDAARRPHGLARPEPARAGRRRRGRRPGRWRCPMSIRSATPRWRTTCEPVVHEIKVRRADLLSRPAPRGQARGLPGAEQRVLVRHPRRASRRPRRSRRTAACCSPATRRWRWRGRRRSGAMRLAFGLWMALARATPVDNGLDEDAQAWLGGTDTDADAAPPT